MIAFNNSIEEPNYSGFVKISKNFFFLRYSVKNHQFETRVKMAMNTENYDINLKSYNMFARANMKSVITKIQRAIFLYETYVIHSVCRLKNMLNKITWI